MGILENLRSTFSGNKEEVFTDRGNDGVITSLFNGFGRQNRGKAEKLSALNCGMNIISNTIASLPVYKYKTNADGSKEKVKDKINYLLNNNCNDYTTAYNMKDMLIKDNIFYGNGYVKIVRDSSFNIIELIPLKQEDVMLYANDNGKSYYYRINLNGKPETCRYHEIINLSQGGDGVFGKGILVTGAESLGLASSQQNYTGASFENGVYTKGVLYVSEESTEEQRKRTQEKLKSFFTKGNSGRLLVLTKDSEYKPMSLSPSDLNLLKEKDFSIQEIARLLKIRPELLGMNISSGNYKNLEEGNKHFIQITLMPYLKNLEATLNHFLLTEEEKESGEYCFCFDLSPLVEGDIKTQYEVLKGYGSNGFMSVKEIRNKLNLPYIEGTDALIFTSFNSILKDGNFINMQSLNKIGDDGEVITPSSPTINAEITENIE